ncbi:MAG: YjcZ family sporulation protein [Bacilli bacterium]|nr:YjcZ family sporulation protein [Acholeplasmataceae bacterium]
MPGTINCCKPVDHCFFGFPHAGRYAFVLVLFILLVIVGTAYWY